MNYRFDGLVHIVRTNLGAYGVATYCRWLETHEPYVGGEQVTEASTCLQCIYNEQLEVDIVDLAHEAARNSARSF